MISRVQSFFGFCSKVVPSVGNSINPVGQFVAYGHYFPKEWSQEYIYSQLDPSKRSITHLQIMRNRLGTSTGKVMIKFVNEEAMRSYIQKYNEDFIVTKEEAHRVIIKPFELKTIAKKEENAEKRTRHAVKVKNLDFDITKEELERLGKDYGKVELVQMEIRSNGLNNGQAIIYFKKAKEAEDFSYFCHDLILRDRKLTAEVINIKDNQSEITYLKEPTITIAANQRLYKIMLAEEVRAKQQQQP